MTVLFGDHRRFQRGAVAMAVLGGGLGVLAWGWGLEAAGVWIAAGLGVAVGAAAAREALRLRRRRLLAAAVIAGVATAAATLAAITWRALADRGAPAAAWDGLVTGLLAGLAVAPALAAAGVRVSWSGRVARALVEARAVLDGPDGEERALVERAAAAEARIAAGLAADGSPDARRLGRLAEDVTVEVLALARRGRRMRGEIARVDLPSVRRRAGTLADQAANVTDESARADLLRAARAAVALDERARALAEVSARMRARVEREVATLEETALAVTACQASAAVGEAAALAAVAERLHEAGRELHDQAQILVDLHR